LYGGLGFGHGGDLPRKSGARFGKFALLLREVHVLLEWFEGLGGPCADIHQALCVVVGLFAAIETACGGGHYFIGLIDRHIRRGGAFADGSRVRGVVQRILRFLQLRARQGAGFNEGFDAIEFDSGARNFGIFGGLRTS
jgi:hypothetical protein